tara:strand:+ start:1386 stop:1757 length:372 start_codon:yes stop_codon:yes gene_type:complete
MIQSIEEDLCDSKLTVKVTCNLKKYASNPIKVLTTEQVIDKISHKYKNIVLISSPSTTVGNTNRRKMSNTGTWIFEVKQEKEEKIEKPKTSRTKKTTPTQKSKQSTTKTSIRGRISKLATKEN